MKWAREDDFVIRTLRDIQRAKIQQPRTDQRVEPCQYSKTGWAVVESDGRCTCQPAKAPVSPANCESKND